MVMVTNLKLKINDFLFSFFNKNYKLEEIYWNNFDHPIIFKRTCHGMCFNYDLIVIGIKPFIMYFKTKRLHDTTSLKDKDSYKYGFDFYTNKNYDFFDFNCYWFQKSFCFYFPWFTWQWESTEILDDKKNVLYVDNKHNKTINTFIKMSVKNAIKEKFQKIFDYKYILKNGTVQERTATVNVSRMTHHRKWFPWIKRSRETIDVKFSDEIGEKTGSWKGGVIGCGYVILPNETVEECLRRMEKERIFK
jgi:hypothetical protein